VQVDDLAGVSLVALPSAKHGGMVSVSVSELRDDPNAATEWDHDVRPKLERNRPDHGWSWQSWYRFTLLPLRARRGFALRVNRNVGGRVLSNPRSHLLTNREQPASYVWFMSAAPDAPWWTMPGFDTEAAARERAALVPRLWLQHFAGTSWIVERGGQLEGFLIAFLSPDRADEGYIHFVGVAPIGGARASDGSCTSASSSAAATPAGSGSVASRRWGIPARSRSIKRWGSNWSGPATRS